MAVVTTIQLVSSMERENQTIKATKGEIFTGVSNGYCKVHVYQYNFLEWRNEILTHIIGKHNESN